MLSSVLDLHRDIGKHMWYTTVVTKEHASVAFYYETECSKLINHACTHTYIPHGTHAQFEKSIKRSHVSLAWYAERGRGTYPQASAS